MGYGQYELKFTNCKINEDSIIFHVQFVGVYRRKRQIHLGLIHLGLIYLGYSNILTSTSSGMLFNILDPKYILKQSHVRRDLIWGSWDGKKIWLNGLDSSKAEIGVHIS